MSTQQGSFDSPNPSATDWNSPFGMARPDSGDRQAEANPAGSVRQDSPFLLASDDSSPPVEPGRPARLPERRETKSPFQLAEPAEGFGLDPASTAWAASPFSSVPGASPFARAAEPGVAPAFALESGFGAPPRPVTAFENWYAAPAAVTPPAVASAFAGQVPSTFAPPVVAPPVAAPPEVPQAFVAPPKVEAPQTPVAAPQSAPAVASQSDSSSIRQLELRAIFGVDREMSPDEILQRSRALPGIRNLTLLGAQELGVVEAFRSLLPGLGFAGELKIFAGAVPLEFIREGAVTLVAQTDGGFAPGVRETLMIVARELGRIS